MHVGNDKTHRDSAHENIHIYLTCLHCVPVVSHCVCVCLSDISPLPPCIYQLLGVIHVDAYAVCVCVCVCVLRLFIFLLNRSGACTAHTNSHACAGIRHDDTEALSYSELRHGHRTLRRLQPLVQDYQYRRRRALQPELATERARQCAPRLPVAALLLNVHPAHSLLERDLPPGQEHLNVHAPTRLHTCQRLCVHCHSLRLGVDVHCRRYLAQGWQRRR